MGGQARLRRAPPGGPGLKAAAPPPAPRWRRFWRVAREAAASFFEHEGDVLAGHLAFMTMLALFPFLIFLLALAGFLGHTDAAARFVSLTLDNIPPKVAEALRMPIYEVVSQRRGGLLTFGIVAALWSAGSGLEAIRTAVNRAYGLGQTRSIWRRRLESFLLVISAAVCAILAMLLLVLGPKIWRLAQQLLFLPDAWWALWLPAQYATGLLVMLAGVCAIYYLLPNVRLRLRWILPGSIVVVFMWLLAVSGFSLYLAHFDNYAVTYGSLGGVVATLLFFYISAAILIFGAEINGTILRSELGPRAP
jgi:membrane protein